MFHVDDQHEHGLYSPTVHVIRMNSQLTFLSFFIYLTFHGKACRMGS